MADTDWYILWVWYPEAKAWAPHRCRKTLSEVRIDSIPNAFITHGWEFIGPSGELTDFQTSVSFVTWWEQRRNKEEPL